MRERISIVTQGLTQVGISPAVRVVFGHALLDHRLHLAQATAALRAGQNLRTDIFPASGVVALIQFVPAGEFGSHGIPQQFHDLDALDMTNVVRAPHVAPQLLVYRRIGEVLGR